MEDDRFCEDPLLITDVCRQQQEQRQYDPPPLVSFQTFTMADHDDFFLNNNDEISWRNRSLEATRAKDFMDPIANDVPDDAGSGATRAKDFDDPLTNDDFDARCKLGISLTSPDLVICSGSPDIPNRTYEDSPELLIRTPVELSFENGITEGPEMNDLHVTPADSEFLKSSKEDLGSSEASVELLQLPRCESVQEIGDNEGEEKGFEKLQVEYEIQKKELVEAKRALEMLNKENECKSRECQEALKSLRELQNELMRKSMHVGSLAFAVEGQVKEKSRWFSSLRDMSRKLKILQMDQIKLLEEAEAYKKCVGDMNISCIIRSKIDEQVKQHEDLKIKLNEGARERKELYNKIQELKGNIRVFCRCRPLNSEEIAEGASMAFDFEASKDGELTVKSNIAFRKHFKFDAVFSPQANQADVFEDMAPFATSVLDGYNVCIFAYGQTGTGKTFTMEGTDEARGVNFRTLQELFCVIDKRKNLVRYEICVSVLEVYNEQIRDLLLPSSQPGVAAKRLEVRQVSEGLHRVPGLVEAQVSNMSEVWEVLKTGSNARAVGSTNANEHSSRSHCIHCVMVKGVNLVNGECTRSKLWLVDLAGSERVAKTEVQGERLKETQNINRSLSALGDVISALATKSPHIPFRNSKLTHLLQDSLGGDSKTLMFVQISPHENDLSESLCSLNFASRVRGIELGPAKKQVDSSEVLKYKQMAERYRHEMKNKDLQVKKLEDTVHGLDVKLKEKEIKNKNLQEKVKELESQLLVERKIARQHVDTKIVEQQQQQMRQQQQEESNSALSRPPLVSRVLSTQKNFNENKESHMISTQQPSAEKNMYKFLAPLPPPGKDLVNVDESMEKENNPNLLEQFPMQRRTGRASICTTSQRVPVRATQRRNSLIPIATTALVSAQFVPQPLPLATIHAVEREDDKEVENAEGLVGPMATNSPKGSNTGAEKLIGVLRRSLHKKNQMTSPAQPKQTRRIGGVNVGMERVRVSIGSRGRLAHRVLLGTGRRAKQQNHKEKERRWNIGTGGRTLA